MAEILPPQPDESLLHPNLQWQLRLLFSVDLVGSTALKQRSAMADGDIEPWLPWFRGFYDGFPLLLDAQYETLPQPVDRLGAVLPKLWKYNGDEVLLHTHLTDYRQALAHIVALAKAIEEWRDGWSKRLPEGHEARRLGKRRFPLDVKGCAWIAGFPVSNSTIGDVPNEPDDFIGPQIDLGFRISRFASRTCLIVDASLAHLLAEAMAGTNGLAACRFHYLGRKRLKGILENLPYPLFAVHVPHGLAKAEGLLLERDQQDDRLPPQDVIHFCEHFHEETIGVGRPFIWKDEGGRFDFSPEHHLHLWKRRGGLLNSHPTNGWNPDAATAEPPEDAKEMSIEEDVGFVESEGPSDDEAGPKTPAEF